jgi:cobalt/nickel transport system permease protein
VLLAIVLGSEAAVVTMTAVLVVQCLLFQDGGLLALGCNIINMGIVPTVLGLGLYRLIARDGAAAWRQYLACWAACAVGVAGGAALVPLEAGISGVLRVPLGQFEALMVAVHLVIGFVEGLITFAVIAYLRQVRPELVGAPAPQAARQPGRAVVAASLLATALLLAGVISWFASEYPDGLEWVLGRSPQAVEPSGTAAAVDEFQSATALLPDYSVRPAPLGEAATGHSAEPAAKGWTSLAGVTGTLAVLGIVALASRAIRRRGGA